MKYSQSNATLSGRRFHLQKRRRVPLWPFAGILLGASAFAPSLFLLMTMGVGALVLLLDPKFSEKTFFTSLTVLLLGYAFLNRGFAHLGTPPIFVGEVVLGLASLSLVRKFNPSRLGFIQFLIIAFIYLGMARTLPYLPQYGADALRDGILWGYAIFALALAQTIKAGHLERITTGYQTILPLFLLWVPVAALLTTRYASFLPVVPRTNVTILFFKNGDAAVHLAAIAAFILLGLYPHKSSTAYSEIWLWVLWLAAVGVISRNRAGLLSSALAPALVFFFRPTRKWLSFLSVAAAVVFLFAFFNPRIDMGDDREISPETVLKRLTSVISHVKSDNLEGTEEFRLRWWGKIVSYTFGGEHFWAGKGFGVNLADEDGFQLDVDPPLRSPHSVHLTVLARMGVPGFLLWLMIQTSFGWSLIRACRVAKRAGLEFWSKLNAWIFGFWIAALINASFDVYLEGPQGGIWFWSVVGIGLAALRLQKEEIHKIKVNAANSWR